MRLLSGIIELKPGWFVLLPYPMTEWEMARWRFEPLTLGALIAGGVGLGALVTRGAFGKQKAVQAPPVPPPPAVPDVGPEVGDMARRKRPRSRRETFLTGDLVPMDLGKSRLLGGGR